MSILNITPSNFVDEYEIVGGKNYDRGIQRYIDENEETYLIDLLGCELFELFKADLNDGIPQDPIYLALYNKICVDLKDNCADKKQIRSDGMILMLVGFIYFQYIRDKKHPNTTTGNVEQKNKNSKPVTFRQMGLPYRYNDAVRNYQNIQLFIQENIQNYPTFNGIEKDIIGLF